MKRLLVAAFGELVWKPPVWMGRGRSARAARFLLGLLAAGALAAAGAWYYRSLPEPLRVQAAATPPGATTIDDEGELAPEPLRLSFRYLPNADVPDPPALSAARLDLVGERVESGIEMRPAHAGEWRFETGNALVFTPSEDWPAGHTFHVDLTPGLFAPGVKLAGDSVSFTTSGFAATLEDVRFHRHPEIAADRRVVATLAFSHPVDRASLEQRLRMVSQTDAEAARTLEYEIEYGPHDRRAHLRSEIVTIGEQEYFVRIEATAGLETARGDDALREPLAAQVRVPDRTSYFRVDEFDTRIVENDAGRALQTAVFGFTDQVDTADFTARVRAWLLPEKRKRSDGAAHRWRSPHEVTEDVLRRAEPLPLTVNPTERDASALQSVVFDAPEDRFVYFRIASGLRSAGGFPMDASATVARAPTYPKDASIAQEGALLPLTGERKLTLSARGVTAVRVEIQQIDPDAVNHLASQTHGDVRDPYFRTWSFDADNISTLTGRTIPLKPAHPGERTFASLDLAPFLADGGLFIVTAQGWDERAKRPVGASDRRLALITDLGLLVKTNADGSQHVFVHSIAGGEPVAGARVQLLGKNGQPVLTAVTDARGHGRLPAAAHFERGREPAVFVVRHRGDATFMPYDRGGRRLSFHGFDVGGEYVEHSVGGGPLADDSVRLRASMHTDRGLYRPGETARIFGIVRRGDFQAVPNAPVELRVRGPRGDLALLRRDPSPPDGFLAWSFETRPESPTGRYEAGLYLVGDDDRRPHLGSVEFSVEDYRPDQLRIRAGIEDAPERGWVRPGAHTARVSLENLFGTPAQSRRVQATLELTPVSPRFEAHEEFVFTDPYRDPDAARRSVTLELEAAATDANGVAHLPFDLAQYDDGIYRLLVTAEGFETDGGRGVKALAGALLSAATALVGHKADGDLRFIARDGARTVSFLAVGPDGTPTPMQDLQAVLVERRYVSALVRQPGGTFAYQSVLKETELRREPASLPADVALPTATPGSFALELVDAEGVKLSRVEFDVAGERNLAGNLERDAELELKLDRAEYAPGEEIVLEVTAPYAGAGLVTIERERVYAFEWFRSTTSTALARITVPEGLEGNAYVNVAFVRDLDSPEIFVSPLSYAVAPFTVDRRARRLDVELSTPDLVRPGETLTVGYRTGVPSRLVVFAVDEGILQVAGYETPRPLDAFLRKKALQVQTHQMADLILPDYNVLRRLAAPGGGDAASLIGANLNPFRRRGEPPVVFFSGIVEAGVERRELSFDVPDYFNGELRVMAVGVGEARMGAARRPVTVRGPLVLTPNLPLAAAPGDVFDVSVGVANHVQGAGPDAVVTLSAASEGLVVEGDAAVSLPVAENGEGRATFRVRAGDAPGDAMLALTATLGGETVRRNAGVSVRPATVFATTVESGFDSRAAQVDLPRRLYAAFAERRVLASASPLALADGLLEYLETFPHGCAEQTVSKTFPLIGLARARSFPLDRGAFDARFRDALAKLRPRQDTSGGFRFWLDSEEAAPFPSVYVAHFLMDARDAGAPAPADMLDAALGYLRDVAGATLEGTHTLEDARIRAYAIYVLTRGGRVTTNYLTALQQDLERRFENEWRSGIGAAWMAASHALLRNERLAGELVASYRIGADARPDTDFDTRLGRDAQYVYLLARHFPDRLDEVQDVVPALVAPIFDNRFNTLSAAYTILALGEIHHVLDSRGGLQTPAVTAGAPQGAPPIEVTGEVFARASLPVGVRQVRIEAANDQGVYYAISESGFDEKAPGEPLAQGIEVDRVYLDAAGEAVTRATVGDVLIVRLRVRSTRAPVHNVAVTDLLPGGFEILADSERGEYGATRIEHRDVREDRLVLYGSFDTGVTEIRYRVKAVAPGEFTAPAAHAEAMYHRDVRGRSAAGRFTVAGA